MGEFTIPQLTILCAGGKMPRRRRGARGKAQPWIRPDGTTSPPRK